ncbi:MAG: tyrosine-type recombinase/integrase [archaeon]|nr:tyrosine-type recombinase/integrase [archaeon]
MKIDPYKHKEKYLAWKEKNKEGVQDITKENSELALRYLNDMEKGINISSASTKGARSYIRLNSLREKVIFFSKRFKEVFGLKRVVDIEEEQLISFFADMKNGIIKRKDGRAYKSIDTHGKIFKAFWHWWQKVNKKSGIEIPDITVDLDTRAEKPDWVYLTESEVKKLCDNAKPEYKTLIMFLFDTGIRAPTELINIKVSDLHNDFKEVNIRDEISKTFGRRIKLMLCSNLIKDYIKENQLKHNDYLFPVDYSKVNEYLKRISKRIFGEGVTPAGQKYSDLTMYDFRHISCCYWLPRYKSESALKYRFGWKKSDRIHYYSELLGMSDTISEDDMLIDVTKTEIEKKLEKSEREKELMQERLKTMEIQLANIMELTNRLGMVAK